MSCSSQHVNPSLFCLNKCRDKKTEICQYCNGTNNHRQLIKDLLQRKRPKLLISTVYIFGNQTVLALDQDESVMPCFSGEQYRVIKSIKERIRKQRPCKIKYKVDVNANFPKKGEFEVIYT